MKQRPNISVQKNTKLINYVREKVLSDINGIYQSGSAQDFNNELQLHNDLVRNNPIPSTQFIPKGKTKSKPNIKVQTRNLDVINKHRIDMMQYANRELSVFADGIATHYIGDPLDGIINYYVLTITSYKILFNNETPTAKDFDIYCNGLLVDKNTYDVIVGENIVITIQKSEAVDDDFDETNFEIVSKFDWINITNEEDFDLTTENGEDIII
jgi:hypothetical protein